MTNIKVVQPSTETPFVLEPSKYYVRPKESITYVDGKFLYCDHKGNEIFRSKGFVGKSVNVLYSEMMFTNLFMDLMRSKQENELFDQHMQILKTAAKKSPIFIGGCGRSGTTLLLSVLDTHPNISSLSGESFAFYPKPFRPGVIAYRLNKMQFNDDQRWCEKTPKHIRAFNAINEVFDGNVKFIYMVRDGRDVVTSVHPTRKNEFWVPIDRWIDDNLMGLSYGDFVYRLKYENLVCDTEKTMRDLCSYLEEDFVPEMMQFNDKTSVREDFGWFSKVQGFHNKRVGKWKNNQFKERVDEFMANRQAVDVMQQLSYL